MPGRAFNLLDTLAKSNARVNAMETEHRDDENMKPKQEDQSDETTMTASIVYLYMRKVTPKMAEEFLTIIKSEEVDMKCNISVEEVIRIREYSRRLFNMVNMTNHDVINIMTML